MGGKFNSIFTSLLRSDTPLVAACKACACATAQALLRLRAEVRLEKTDPNVFRKVGGILSSFFDVHTRRQPLFKGQVDAADASGRTGLHWAAERGDAGLCSLLLASGDLIRDSPDLSGM